MSPRYSRLLLFALDWTRPKDPRIPLGHASILAAIQKHSSHIHITSSEHHVNDFSFNTARAHLRQFINDYNNDNTCIGLGVYIWNDHIVSQLIKDAREMGYKGTIVLGGPQISYSGPEENLESVYPQADAFVRGYGENVLVELLKSSPSSRVQIKGLHWKGIKDLNLQAEPSLETLPSPHLSQAIPLSPFIRWETQRGCPFRCSFCQHREAGNMQRRNLYASRIFDEIDLFSTNQVEDIAVLDPTFNSGPQYKSVLSRFISNNFKGRLSLQCRFEMVDNEFLELCSQLNVRLEFGLQTIHKKEQQAIDRPNNMKKIRQIIDELNRRNIAYEVSLIFGLPHQTLESFKETVDFCLQNKVPVVKAFPLMLLRGTLMHKNKSLYGLVENKEIIPSVISSPTFTFHDWKKMELISQILRDTEGRHPNNIEELLGNPTNTTFEYKNDVLWSPSLE